MREPEAFGLANDDDVIENIYIGGNAEFRAQSGCGPRQRVIPLCRQEDRTERPDFGVLGAVDETLNAAGLDFDRTDATMSTDPGAVNTVLPSSPLLCATLDEVRRFAESQGKGRYNPDSDRRVALDLIAALAGIVQRQGQDNPSSNELEAKALDFDQRSREAWEERDARTTALDFSIRANPGHHKPVVEAAHAFHAFLTGKPSGKVYATKADVERLHSRIDDLAAEMQRAVSGA